MKKENVLDSLSERETQLIQWISKGFSRSEIADKMNMSVNTYDGYRKNIRMKLSIKNQADWAHIITQVK